eukprot:Hpha_TRINITY_DN9068_c0_g1::TRINITY_DN9068_c0_g1_i1::g.141959::m.141959
MPGNWSRPPESRLKLLVRSVVCAAAIRDVPCKADALTERLRMLAEKVDSAPSGIDLIDPELELWEPALLKWAEGSAPVSDLLRDNFAIEREATLRAGVEVLREASRLFCNPMGGFGNMKAHADDEGTQANIELLLSEVDLWERFLVRRRGSDGSAPPSEGATAHAQEFLSSVAVHAALRDLAQGDGPFRMPEDTGLLEVFLGLVVRRREDNLSYDDVYITPRHRGDGSVIAQDTAGDPNLVMWGGDTSPRAPDSPKRATRRALDEHNSKRPLMADERQRLASFVDFPISGQFCNPRELAAAGFFHAPLPGHPDGVSCFSCGLWLCGWDPEDDPVEAHEEMDTRQCNECKYLKSMNQEELEEPLTLKAMAAAAGEEGRREKKLVSGFGVPGRQVLFNPDRMRALFDQFDTDKSGFISREEFKNIWRTWETFGVDESDRELERVFSQFDSHSGEDDRLSFQEFSMLILQRLKM